MKQTRASGLPREKTVFVRVFDNSHRTQLFTSVAIVSSRGSFGLFEAEERVPTEGSRGADGAEIAAVGRAGEGGVARGAAGAGAFPGTGACEATGVAIGATGAAGFAACGLPGAEERVADGSFLAAGD